MAQVLEMVRTLQDNAAASRVEQERMQTELAASQSRNDELNRVNEELRRTLQAQREHAVDERVSRQPSPRRAFPMPFSPEVMGTMVPPNLVGVKASFTGVRSLPEGHIMSFPQFSKLFIEQYIVNKAPAVVSYDLFDVRHYQGESLKDYLTRFGAQVVRLPSKDEDMLVHAFKKGVLPDPFSESLIRSHPSTFAEIRRRAVAHIVAETEVSEKRGSAAPPRPRGGQGKP